MGGLRGRAARSRRVRASRPAIVCLLLAIVALGGCREGEAARDLRELVIRDSTYYAPETMQPFTGRIFRPFPADSTRTEIEGALVGGTWHGELTVYHASGRIRYMGSFWHGERCGPWTENTSDREPVDVYDQLLTDIETLGLYPPCPTDP